MEIFRSAEAEAAVTTFVTRASDVFVATYSKSGTTWMQQIVHQLRSGGSVDFREISEVAPWLESAVDMGINPDADQTGYFRVFKCHLTHQEIPKGARYISVFREPKTVLPSFYHFFEGWWFEPGSIGIEDFAREMYMQGSAAGRHWDHLLDWWRRRSDEDTLLLCYEDMVQAPERVPVVVADFLNMQLDNEVMSKVIQHSSRQYMLSHSTQFDDHLLREHRDAIWGLPPGGNSSKVAERATSVGLSNELLTELEIIWQDTIGAATGLNSYAEFRRSLPNPLQVKR